ncbi:translational GTPase TypA [Candidatus Chromulinivorax destructor]|uniref:50S ribosomal subunit assembly factor BipA n=1 Tax=Candidatus Chromulinivorax destructor TaxID=2066483 RepID=A0A345ZBC9_9BACT|nr:translational GTPase TypA [Candidatus Chromulinivorax destructor]AXK60596.1 translational GTPase TypA [Candidatus Chromulinivorax destructor]
MDQSKIRNVAIIAHVDHGKTTMVDEIFKQSDSMQAHHVIEERLMDSIDLEKERGITIKSKNGSCMYKDYFINIIDTPGHADFGGEVERVLKMADGVLFLVDAAEGPMPQSFFVLKKAVALNLPVVVVVNKIDKETARIEWVIDQVFDLLVGLNAPDEILDFKVVYASARNGWATTDYNVKTDNIKAIFEAIVNYIPAPKGDPNGPFQMLVSSIDHSAFMGRLAIGKVTSGSIALANSVVAASENFMSQPIRVTKLYRFERNKHMEIETASVGEIIAVAGFKDILVGQTVTSASNPIPLPSFKIDPPTVAIKFLPNDSPLSGQEGDFITSRQLHDRLHREPLSDIAMQVEDDGIGFKVSGRGELHLSIFIEKLRREGYEFQVSRPEVVFQVIDGKKMEPYETVTIDVATQYIGKIIEAMGTRKGQMTDMREDGPMTRLIYEIPTRGILGYQADFMMDTKGMGIMSSAFDKYGPYIGEIRLRQNGVMIAMESGKTTSYALEGLEDRGVLIMGSGQTVYEGQIVGKHSRDNDLTVNACKGKKLTNMRASGSDDSTALQPHLQMTLEQCLSFIMDDELIEFTPKSIRLRKMILNEGERKRSGKKS